MSRVIFIWFTNRHHPTSWNDKCKHPWDWELVRKVFFHCCFRLFVYDELSHPNAVKSLPNNYPIVGHKLLFGNWKLLPAPKLSRSQEINKSTNLSLSPSLSLLCSTQAPGFLLDSFHDPWSGLDPVWALSGQVPAKQGCMGSGREKTSDEPMPCKDGTRYNRHNK